MRLSRDNVIGLCVLAAMAAGYFLSVYRAQSAALGDVCEHTARTKRWLEDKNIQAARVPPMVRQIQRMKRRYNTDWDRRLPQRKELADFLREIAANLAQEQLSNEIIRPGDPTRGTLYNCLPITMKFEGDFLALAGFLRRVDGMARLTRVEYLKIGPGPKAGRLLIEVGMNIYFTEQ